MILKLLILIRSNISLRVAGIIIMLFCISSCLADIHYDIQHRDDRIYVKAEFKEYRANEPIALYIPSKVWGINYEKQIKNIKVYNGSLNIQDSTAVLDKDGILKVEYELVNISKAEFLSTFANRYYHFFDEQRFYLLGIGSFIYPKEYEENNAQENVVINLNSTVKRIAYNFAPYFYNLPLNIPFKKLQDIIILGNTDFYFRCDAAGGITFLLWSPDQALGKRIANIVTNTLAKHKEFWGNKEIMQLVLSIPNPFYPKWNGYGATVIKDSIIAFVNPDMNTDEDLYNLFNHEGLHFWFGCNTLKGPSWFTEGFTDYYMDKINYHYSGDFKAFINNYNYKLYLYFSSPFYSLTNKDIEQHFFYFQVVEKLPYLRGYLIAGQIDSITNLDSILKSMFNDCRQNKQHCTFSTRLLAEYIQNLSKKQQQHIYNLITNFNKAKLVNRFLGKARLSSKMLPLTKYVDLNVIEIVKTGHVTGRYLNSLDQSFDVNKIYTLFNIEQDYENNLRFFVEDRKDIHKEFSPLSVPIVTKIPQYNLKK